MVIILLTGTPRFLRKRWALAEIFSSTLIGMSIFEITKQVIAPETTIWESHVVTIIFTSFIAVFIAFFPIRAMQTEHQRAMNELNRMKSAEEWLQNSEAQYLSFVDSTENSIYTVDTEGRFLMMNRQHMIRLGLSKGMFEGHEYEDFHTPGETARFISLVKRVVEENDRLIEEYDNNERTFLRQLNPVSDPSTGNTIAVTVVSTDITERKHSERAIMEANRKLNLMSEITRHDILNQLLALNGYLDLAKGLTGDPMADEYLMRCEDAVRTIRTQISFTRDYQNIGIKTPEWQNVSGIISQVQRAFLLANVTVISTCEDLEVFADPLLEKVFYNLIDNALKYGGNRLSKIRISFLKESTDDRLTIICEDDGIGISPEDKQRMFNRGFGKNTGLGLFLAREILSITGITITETGELGKGARFEILVPKGAYRAEGRP